MSVPAGAGPTLTAAVDAGVRLSASHLERITGAPWRVLSVVLSEDGGGLFADAHADVAGDHYGSHFTFAGGSFLVLFSGKSGFRVASAFTRDFSDRIEGIPKRESVALGEAANVLLNPLVGHVARAWGVRLIVSAPQTKIASPRDHLARALDRYREGDRLGASFFAALDSPKLSGECGVMLFLDRELVGKISGPAASR